MPASLCYALDHSNLEKTSIAAAADVQHVAQGFWYLGILAVALIIMVSTVAFVNKKK